MLHFPVQFKPEFDTSKNVLLYEYENVISDSIADELISYAVNSPYWHRRGAKSVNVKAQFNTTLMVNKNHEIYEILDTLWKNFIDEQGYDIDFVEYYEIKGYKVGDFFDMHVDVHGNVEQILDRKLNMIVQLSDPDDYSGGDLVVRSQQASRKRGTAIIFPSSYGHYVTKITEGTRFCLIGHAWGNLNRK